MCYIPRSHNSILYRLIREVVAPPQGHPHSTWNCALSMVQFVAASVTSKIYTTQSTVVLASASFALTVDHQHKRTHRGPIIHMRQLCCGELIRPSPIVHTRINICISGKPIRDVTHTRYSLIHVVRSICAPRDCLEIHCSVSIWMYSCSIRILASGHPLTRISSLSSCCTLV